MEVVMARLQTGCRSLHEGAETNEWNCRSG